MLQDFRAKIGEATEAVDTLAATLLYDEGFAPLTREQCVTTTKARTQWD
ncbi:hypothetical protein ACWGQT_09340 [Streptomyces yangpuensis]